MNVLTVCSGIGAPECAWTPLGFKFVGSSEIEPFPSAVLSQHYPDVPNFGDLNNFDEWNIDDSAISLVVGGTPCQAFSVAGLRRGLDDSRGNLSLTFIRLCRRVQPEWIVWENVPGVLSSNGGKDFGAFTGALSESGYSFSWRVLDAQFFGIPQRRRRVFVVGYRGNWRYPAAVLFEPKSMRGDTKKSGKAGEDIVPTVEKSTGITMYENHATDSRVREVAVCPTVTARWGTGGNNTPLVQSVYENQKADVSLSDKTNTLTAGGGKPGQGYAAILENQTVRRLIPSEAELLMGFPKGYTDIPYRGKPAPDSQRYKALGNSMAVPVLRWIAERMLRVKGVIDEHA